MLAGLFGTGSSSHVILSVVLLLVLFHLLVLIILLVLSILLILLLLLVVVLLLVVFVLLLIVVVLFRRCRPFSSLSCYRYRYQFNSKQRNLLIALAPLFVIELPGTGSG